MADAYRKLAAKGVNLIRNKYSPDDQTVLNAQNAELVLDKELSGRMSLRKRGGLVSTGAVFSSGIFEMYEVKFLEASGMTPDVPPGSITFRPIADELNVGDDTWITAPLFSKLDEVSLDDTDFIRTFVTSSLETVPNRCRLSMTSTVFTGVATSGTLRVRARYNDNGGLLPVGTDVISIALTTTNGTVSIGATALAKDTDLTSSFQTFSLDLFNDLLYAGGSFDWSDVELTLLVNPGASGIPATDTIDVSWVELVMAHS